jgi:hypothetical protein
MALSAGGRVATHRWRSVLSQLRVWLRERFKKLGKIPRLAKFGPVPAFKIAISV